MAEILVLANETIGGEKLLDAIRERNSQGDARFHVVVRDSAQVRIDLALAFMREEGIQGTGEVGDADPFNAAMDAVREYGITEIIVSTLPTQASAWIRRELVERLEALAKEGPHRFIIVVPQDDGDGRAVKAARARLGQLLSSLADEG